MSTRATRTNGAGAKCPHTSTEPILDNTDPPADNAVEHQMKKQKTVEETSNTVQAATESTEVVEEHNGAEGNVAAKDVAVNTNITCSEDTMKCINDILKFADHKNNRFAPTVLPISACWGSASSRNDLSRYLIDKGRIVILYITGTIDVRHFIEYNGKAPGRVKVAIVPAHNDDRNALMGLLACSMPSIQPKEQQRIWAGKLMGSLSADLNSYEPTNAYFDKIYDLTTKSGLNELPKRLTVRMVNPGDIVLAEVYLTRYKPKNIKADKQGWAEWSTAFQLRSLSVLEFGAGERRRSPEVEVPELPLCI